MFYPDNFVQEYKLKNLFSGVFDSNRNLNTRADKENFKQKENREK